MSLFADWKAGDLKWNMERSWMSHAERKALKKFRDSGHVSSFRILICKGAPEDKDGTARPCRGEVPILVNDDGQQIKLYCSKDCYDSINAPAE
jgi:hypothetical protein